jgi:hypothetical protein
MMSAPARSAMVRASLSTRWKARAHGKGWLLNFASRDTQPFDATLAAVKHLPYPLREWRRDERVWWIHRAAVYLLALDWPELAAMLREQDRASRAEDEPPPRHRRRRRQAAEEDAPAQVPTDVRAAFATMHLLPSATPKIVQAVYRVLARELHPDTGGEAIARVNDAYATARAWTEHYPAPQTRAS